jgi:chromosome partitioning protein
MLRRNPKLKNCSVGIFTLAQIQRISESGRQIQKQQLFDSSTHNGERALMFPEKSRQARVPRVIVVGNEKGGSGKSTVAVHIAVALMKSGASVATIDLDARQGSFTQYIENRRAWAERVGRDLGIPNHIRLDGKLEIDADERAARCEVFTDTVAKLAQNSDYIVIDTPGHDSFMVRFFHSIADTLITPLNDSFVDFDVLAHVDPETFAVTGTSHYAQMVEEARSQRRLLDNVDIDWIVLRNRLSTLGSSRNKRFVGAALQELSQKLNFRFIDGLAERVIFREFYPRGLTAVDDIDEITLGTRPTMSHVTARLEMESLLSAILLGGLVQSDDRADHSRDVA